MGMDEVTTEPLSQGVEDTTLVEMKQRGEVFCSIVFTRVYLGESGFKSRFGDV